MVIIGYIVDVSWFITEWFLKSNGVLISTDIVYDFPYINKSKTSCLAVTVEHRYYYYLLESAVSVSMLDSYLWSIM